MFVYLGDDGILALNSNTCFHSLENLPNIRGFRRVKDYRVSSQTDNDNS